MKKITFILASLIALSASAQTVTSTYDTNENGLNEAKLGVSGTTKYGVLTGSVVGTSGTGDRGLGFEGTLGNSFSVYSLPLQTTVGFGRVNQLDTGNVRYWTAGVSTSKVLADKVTGTVGFRHRNFKGDVENRVQAGLNLDVYKNTVAGVAVTRTLGDSHVVGVSGSLSYKF